MKILILKSIVDHGLRLNSRGKRRRRQGGISTRGGGRRVVGLVPMYVARGILVTRLMGGKAIDHQSYHTLMSGKVIDHPLIGYVPNKVKMRQIEEEVEEGRAVDVTPPDDTPTEKSLIE